MDSVGPNVFGIYFSGTLGTLLLGKVFLKRNRFGKEWPSASLVVVLVDGIC